ncbi:uncharacterized protein LOC142766540 [Rhipicephalus microplus]|uniref:uncharacterized protein LOC142766540 n=1 Tax=Rhipicephalus microplus TaxID=6941 RepID=UPI003F6D372D
MRLTDTLRSFLEDDQIYKLFSKAPNDQGERPLKDISDGAKYLEHPGRCRYDFSLFWNTDGVQVFKSAAKSLWPLHCIIPELPPLMRKKFQILTLLWFGTKPTINTFLKPFCAEVRELATEGLTWRHPETGKSVISYVTAPLSSVDAVARAMLQGVKQFNGLYGCSFCEHPGVLHSLGKQGRVRVYPPGKRYFSRNSRRMRQHAALAVQTGHPVKGVKGPTILHLLPHFDCGAGFVVDYMHCVLLGVVRMLISLWFETKYHKSPWYLGGKIKLIDSQLLSIRPPDYVTRTPRSIKHCRYWKASELRAWLLFYSFPILRNVLPDVYLHHLSLLISAIYILLSESITQEQVDVAEQLLVKFVDEQKVLYGERFCSFNVHQLTHIADSVRNWGPLWAASAFMFEDRNGQLLRLIKGTQAIEKQLATLVGVSTAVSVLHKRVRPLSPAEFVLSKLDSVHFSKVSVPNGTVFHGLPCQTNVAVKAVLTRFFQTANNVTAYKKVTVNSETFSSALCTNQLRRNNFTIMWIVGEQQMFASVHCFVKWEGQLFLVVKRLYEHGDEQAAIAPRHIIQVRTSEHLDVVPAPSKMTKCVRVLDFVIISPNFFELNL